MHSRLDLWLGDRFNMLYVHRCLEEGAFWRSVEDLI